jgi:hypothetical protein
MRYKTLAVIGLIALLLLAGCDATPTKSTTGSSEETATGKAGPLELAVGESADYDGLKVTVVEAKAGPKDWQGKPTFMVKVRYENGTDEAASFNEFDWYIEDKEGARTQETAILESSPETLSSGEIAPGGSKTGVMYFSAKGAVAKVIYEPSWFATEENLATWIIAQQ